MICYKRKKYFVNPLQPNYLFKIQLLSWQCIYEQILGVIVQKKINLFIKKNTWTHPNSQRVFDTYTYTFFYCFFFYFFFSIMKLWWNFRVLQMKRFTAYNSFHYFSIWQSKQYSQLFEFVYSIKALLAQIFYLKLFS